MRHVEITPEMKKAADEFTNAEFYLSLVERYQHNKPHYIKGAQDRVEKARAEVERLFKKMIKKV